ncbi:MAG: hypothetical protein H0U55_07010, partial [Rubrobacteraceae bacterium]|nr:hypothetical protein [Rubrobacteraceae bacterium]
MARKKITTYVDEDLLRSAKILAAKRNGKIYEVFEEVLTRYLKETATNGGEASLAEVLSGERSRREPGVHCGKAVELAEGDTLSEA